jgi:anti-anti-sigma factor
MPAGKQPEQGSKQHMQINTSSSADGSEVTIVIEGRFDHTVQHEFRNAYRHRDGWPERYRIILTRADYMDSSALGMLLLLRDHAQAGNADVVIVEPSEQIMKILETAHFNQLFTTLKAT